jgi:hypothetical protein
MLDDLYENIGEQIKGWAKWIFAIEAAAAIVCGLFLIFDDAALAGIIVLIVVPLVAWVSSWLLYAFGELVDKTVANEKHTKDILKILEAKDKPQIKVAPPAPRPVATRSWRCDNCGNMTTQSPCEHCGYDEEKKHIPYWCGNCGHAGPYDDRCPTCGSSLKRFNVSQN